MSPTAAQVLAALAALPSTVAGGPYATDSGSSANINIMKTSTGAYWWKADMDIDTDGQPFPEQDNNSDRQTETSFTQSDGKPLNSGKLPFIVIPLPSSRFNYRDAGIRGGDSCIAILNGKMVYAVFGDEGPTGIIGEASYAAAKALGVPGIPYGGWDGKDVTYIVFPGSRVSPIESVAAGVAKGEANAAALIAAAGNGGTEAPPVTTPTSAIDKMVAEAVKTLGMSDENNTVQTPIHTWYNNKFGNPDPGKYAWDWCDGGVTYWAWMSGNQQAVVFGGAYAYTVAHAQAFKDRGQWHTDTAGIQRGDIVFFDWDGSNNISAIDHVGIVESVSGSTVNTIEANIENAVRRKVRDSSTIVGYGRPNYVGGTTPPPSTGGGAVKLSEAQAHADGATRIIQAALNQTVDGDFGPQTTAAYKAWQQSLGWPGDGQPSAHSLYMLGKAKGFAVDLEGAKPIGPDGKDASAPTTPPVDPPVDPPANTYTVKAGDTLSSIAAALGVEGGALALYEANKATIGDIHPGMVLAVPGAAQEPDPDPEPEPEPDPEPEPPATKPLAGKSAVLEEVYLNAPVSESVKVVQTALNLEFGNVVVDGQFGPATKAAYAKWQVKLGYSGSDADGNPGATSFAKLAEKYGFTVKAAPPAAPVGNVADYLTAAEPAMDMTRTTYGGKTVNKRTAALLARAASWAGVTITLTQGSYNAGGVAASAGTHDGGGVVDINVNSWSTATRNAVVLALRKAGFAAWLRTPADGFAYHIHANAIGDRDMSSSAKSQVVQYFNGTNGLANRARDNFERRWPNWADKYNN